MFIDPLIFIYSCKEVGEYIQNLKTKFGNFNYALDGTMFEPMEYKEYLNNMIAPEILPKSLTASPEYSPINPAVIPVNSADSVKRPATEATNELMADGRKKLKLHFEGIVNVYVESEKKLQEMTNQKNTFSQKVEQLEGMVLDLKEKLDAANHELAGRQKNTCVICDKECFKFCGITCMK